MARKLIPFEALKPEKGIGHSKTHIWRLEKAGLFPRRVKIGSGEGGRSSHTWVESEIDAHIEALIAAREEELSNDRESESDDSPETAKAAPRGRKAR